MCYRQKNHFPAKTGGLKYKKINWLTNAIRHASYDIEPYWYPPTGSGVHEVTAIDCFRQRRSLSLAPRYSNPALLLLSIDGTDRRTDGRTPDRYTDHAQHTMWAAWINEEQATFCSRIKINLLLCSFINFFTQIDTISQSVSSHEVLRPRKQSVLQCLWRCSESHWRWNCDGRRPVYYTVRPLLSTAGYAWDSAVHLRTDTF